MSSLSVIICPDQQHALSVGTRLENSEIDFIRFDSRRFICKFETVEESIRGQEIANMNCSRILTPSSEQVEAWRNRNVDIKCKSDKKCKYKGCLSGSCLKTSRREG